MANRMGTTTAAVKLRAGPGIEHPVRAFLPPQTPVEIWGLQDDWLQVKVGDKEGYLHNKFVMLPNQGVAEGFLLSRVEPPAAAAVPAADSPAPSAAESPAETPGSVPLAEVPLPPPDDQRLMVPATATALERLAANTWNRYGGLLSVLAKEFKVDPAVAVAVMAVESGGRGFGPDGRMLIRFENQIFFDNWGKKNPERYHQHFRYHPEKRWTEHQWRPAPEQDWRDFHGNQAAEWEVFEFARRLHDTAAKLSISMGGPQIMGFNYAALGFESVHQMFDAFAESERNQVIGFFDFVQGPSSNSRRVIALQSQDFETFASMYNGPGQAAKYGSLIRSLFSTFHRLRAA